MSNELFNEEQEFEQYYNLQNSLREKVIKEDQLAAPIKYIAGVDVAYNDAPRWRGYISTHDQS
jgi:deoxyribonuclease V